MSYALYFLELPSTFWLKYKKKSETELTASVLKKRSKTHKRLKERFTEQNKTCKFSM